MLIAAAQTSNSKVGDDVLTLSCWIDSRIHFCSAASSSWLMPPVNLLSAARVIFYQPPLPERCRRAFCLRVPSQSLGDGLLTVTNIYLFAININFSFPLSGPHAKQALNGLGTSGTNESGNTQYFATFQENETSLTRLI